MAAEIELPKEALEIIWDLRLGGRVGYRRIAEAIKEQLDLDVSYHVIKLRWERMRDEAFTAETREAALRDQMAEWEAIREQLASEATRAATVRDWTAVSSLNGRRIQLSRLACVTLGLVAPKELNINHNVSVAPLQSMVDGLVSTQERLLKQAVIEVQEAAEAGGIAHPEAMPT